MTEPLGPDSPDPAEEALNWLIALEDCAAGAEAEALRARLEVWLAASPAHRAAWDEACKVWHLLGEAGPAESAGVGRQPPPARARLPKARLPKARLPKARLPKARVAVAAVALAACLLVFLAPDMMLRLEADVVTAVGETRQITLADGSRLSLAPDSAVRIDYSATARRIDLLAGTAYVEVEPDPARRFTVAAERLESSALGTAYEVRRLDSGTLVSVAHGTVAAEDAATGLDERLEAGDWLHVASDGRSIRRGTDGRAAVAAWRDGRLVVKDWPLSDVVATLRHHFHGAIVILDDAVGARRVTGIYDLTDPAAALRAATYPTGARIHEVTPWMLVVSPG